MKYKTFKPKIRPFKGACYVSAESGNDLLEFIVGMGYLIFEDPLESGYIIVSDKVLTYGDLRKNPKRFNLTQKDLAHFSEFPSHEELYEACI